MNHAKEYQVGGKLLNKGCNEGSKELGMKV